MPIHHYFYRGVFTIAIVSLAATAAPDCRELLVRAAPRPKRQFNPTVEPLEGRLPLTVSVPLGNLPDDSVVYLLGRTAVLVPGVQPVSSNSLEAYALIGGTPFVELENGNYVPANYVAIPTDGGFIKFNNLDPSSPDFIPQRGLTIEEILTYKANANPRPAPRSIRRSEPLLRPPVKRLKALRVVLHSQQRSQMEKLAHAHAQLETLPKNEVVFMDLKDAEARWGDTDYTIDGFREGDRETRAAMAVNLLRNQHYLGAEFYVVTRDFGKSDGFFINDAVPAYLIDGAEVGDRWQVIFLPNREGTRVEAIRIHRVVEPPLDVDYSAWRWVTPMEEN